MRHFSWKNVLCYPSAITITKTFVLIFLFESKPSSFESNLETGSLFWDVTKSNINNLQSSGKRNFYSFHSHFLFSSNITHMLALYNIKTVNNMNLSLKRTNKVAISVKTKFLIYSSVLWEKQRETESCLTDIAHFVYCTTGRCYVDILRWWGQNKKVSKESSRERRKT